MTRHTLARAYAGLLAALLAGAAVAAVAFAKGSTAPTLGSAANAKLATDVVVDPIAAATKTTARGSPTSAARGTR